MKRAAWFAFLTLVLCLVSVTFAASQKGDSQKGDPQAEWQKSKHANRQLAVDDATWEDRKEDAAHCGRCHSEQGFKAWLPQLLKGDAGPFKKPDGSKADEAYIRSLGLTKDKIQPTTCEVCHTSDFALRIQDNVAMMANGVPARAFGKGALCMACHNTRNGRVTWDSPEPKKYMQPHDASQTDVLLGKNAYFVDDTGDTASPHALFTGDSCVTCHYTLGKEGHTFRPGECAACHGENMKEEYVQKGTTELLKQLAAAIQKRLSASKEKIACVTSWDEKTDKDTPNTPIDGTKIKSMELPPGIHGQLSLKLVMQDGKVIMSQLGNVKDACGEQGKPVYATSDPVIRALWNYWLITYDGSKGVHNPRFTRNALIATIGAVSK